jgi:stage II sporulation protein R
MKKIIIIATLFILILSITNKQQDLIIPKESIRFRIIANSNEVEDQLLKKDLASLILNNSLIKTNNLNDINETRKIINEEIPNIKAILDNNNLNYNINYGDNYFPDKYYKGIKYDEGLYESLVISIGEGLGDNWWCVLFPPLCLLEAQENELEEVQYKSYIKEILNK